MPPLISCLCPTFNRYPLRGWLLEEAVEAFLRQTDQDSELIVGNDAPGQTLVCDHPRVRVLNRDDRLPTLSDKLQWMIDEAQGDLLCRWDDDDISLPHRLAFSRHRLEESGRPEWRAENYWFDCGPLRAVKGAGNTHVMALWRRDVLAQFPDGLYPQKHSGFEDQAFNALLRASGQAAAGDVVTEEEIYYLYRWAVSDRHLSGVGGPPENLQAHYDRIGQQHVARANFEIRPRWLRNHSFRAAQAIAAAALPPWDYTSQNGYFDYAEFYDSIVASAPPGAKLVEIGCLSGRSLCHLGEAARRAGRRLEVWGVDLGVGVYYAKMPQEVYHSLSALFAVVMQAGLQDTVSLVAAESVQAAERFADGELFFAFVDAAHDYQSVRGDLAAWWPKIAPGGILAGHDYGKPDTPGVALAVDEFFGKPPGSLRVPGSASCWSVRKE